MKTWIAVGLLTSIFCADSHGGTNADDVLLYRDQGRLHLFTTDGRCDTTIRLGNDSVWLYENDRELGIRCTIDLTHTPWWLYAEIRQERGQGARDGLILVHEWAGPGDNPLVYDHTRKYHDLPSAWRDPAVANAIAPMLARIGQNPQIPSLADVLALIEGEAPISAGERLIVRGLIRQLAIPAQRKSAIRSLRLCRRLLHQATSGMDLSIDERTTVEAIESTDWIHASAGLLLMIEFMQ
ncbi:MAG TPA: hypothetical protein VK797_22940 [Tepidisphaeraceae bacterium]|jgi:hypothetical protein|nr:hypothetical protein [Tepidisphaeraceae bacterium]